MKFGLLKTNFCLRDRDPSEVYDEFLDIGEEAERLGYWSLYTSEHHFATDPEYRPFAVSEDVLPVTDYDISPDPLVLLTHVAARTNTIRLGTALAGPIWDHPIRLAERAAMVDLLSRGRLELGIGPGNDFRAVQVFDVPIETAAAMRKFHEAVEIMQLAWLGERFSYQGEFYTLRDIAIVPRPRRQPAPLWILTKNWNRNDAADARESEAAAAWIGSRGMRYLANTFPFETSDVHQQRRAAYLQAAAEAGHNVSGHEHSHLYFMYCGESEAEVEETMMEYLRRYQWIVEAHYERNRAHTEIDWTPEQLAVFEAVEQNARDAIEGQLIGTPEQVAEKLAVFRDELGLRYVLLYVGLGNMPHEMTLASIRRFAEQVMPRFSGAALGATSWIP